MVTCPLPFRLEIKPPLAPLVQGGSKDIRVTVARNEGFDGAIRVYTLYNPPGVSSNRSLSIPKGKSEVRIPFTANPTARPGDWNLTIVGELNSGGRVYSSTPFIAIKVTDPYFDMKVPTTVTKQAQEVELVVGLSQRTPFAGEAELQLIRLPHGVTALPVRINPESKTAVF